MIYSGTYTLIKADVPEFFRRLKIVIINNFTSAMVTAGAVIFLVTPGQKIAVFTLFDCINTGRYGEASMIATFIIAITITVNVIFSILVAWKGRRKRVFRTEKCK